LLPLSDFTQRYFVSPFFTVVFCLVARQPCSQTAQFLIHRFPVPVQTALLLLVFQSNNLVLWVSCWQILSPVNLSFLLVSLRFPLGARTPASWLLVLLDFSCAGIVSCSVDSAIRSSLGSRRASARWSGCRLDFVGRGDGGGRPLFLSSPALRFLRSCDSHCSQSKAPVRAQVFPVTRFVPAQGKRADFLLVLILPPRLTADPARSLGLVYACACQLCSPSACRSAAGERWSVGVVFELPD
jgi:hypothetical protein